MTLPAPIAPTAPRHFSFRQELPGARAACAVRLLGRHYLGKHSRDAWSPELETRCGQETPVRCVAASRKPSPASAGSCARDLIRRGRLWRGVAVCGVARLTPKQPERPGFGEELGPELVGASATACARRRE